MMCCLHTSLQTEWRGGDRQRQLQCKYFARAVNTDYNRERQRERERGRKSLSGEMVGSRDVNARESRGEKACQHLDVGMEREKGLHLHPFKFETVESPVSCT